MLGRKTGFDAVLFFRNRHCDTAISHVGRAEQWDRSDLDGDLAARDTAVTFWHHGRKLAVAPIGSDFSSLRAESAFEKESTA